MEKITFDRAILNLCHARGMPIDGSLDFLAAAKRIELWRAGWNRGTPTDEIATISETEPLFHRARLRITRIEKAMIKVANGEPHGISRKKWRQHKEDCQNIIATLAHVLSRPRPTSKDDILQDALKLLLRTGEKWDERYRAQPPPTIPGQPPLCLGWSGNAMKIDDAHTPKYRILSQTPGVIQIHIRAELPQALVGSLISRLQGGEKILARDVVDWKAFDGPFPSLLTRIVPEHLHWPSGEYGTALYIETGLLQYDPKAKQICC